jgi:hypothetical protein
MGRFVGCHPVTVTSTYNKQKFVYVHRLEDKPEQVAELPPVSDATVTNEHAALSGAHDSHSSPKPVGNSAAAAGDHFMSFCYEVEAVMFLFESHYNELN